MEIQLSVNKIRNINSLDATFPLTKGMYALVGENGCGKSTLMLIMSLMVKTSSAHMLTLDDIEPESTIDITTATGHDRWFYKNNKMTTGKFTYVKANRTTKHSHSALVVNTHLPGFYEGSIFYGCRFDDFDRIETFLQNPNYRADLTLADRFVAEKLGFILHDDISYYCDRLYRVKNRATAESRHFKGIPYFCEYNGRIVSQFKMSSGECMLISLIDFINNLIVKNQHFSRFLFLIDEIELALHPGAIERLMVFLNETINSSRPDITIYFSTHSSELINRIPPRNIFLIENIEGTIHVTNPCYPNYATRSLYIPNGYDYIFLVEDELAKVIVEKVIRDNRLSESKLCCVLPAGGYIQMLRLHSDMVTYNTLGVGKHIISIFDGDVKTEVSKIKKYSSLPKCFLPIPSIEKYLKKKFIDEPDQAFIKRIGDKYFIQRSLPEIIREYRNNRRTNTQTDRNGKDFYKIIIAHLESIGLQESDFIKYLADDIFDYEKPEKFVARMRSILSI